VRSCFPVRQKPVFLAAVTVGACVADCYGAPALQSAHHLVEREDRGGPVRTSSGNFVTLNGDRVLYYEQPRKNDCEIDLFHFSQPGE
jgi:hypothetical protein